MLSHGEVLVEIALYSLEKLEDTGGLLEKRHFWEYFCDRSTSRHLADGNNTGKSKIWNIQKKNLIRTNNYE
jgi:hypothetical protein